MATKYKENLQMLQCLTQIIFELSLDNINESVKSSLNYFYKESPLSFNIIVCNLLYSYFEARYHDYFCIKYLKELEIEESKYKNISHNKVIEIFVQLLLINQTQESNYLLEKMIKNGFANSEICKIKRTPYFVHRGIEESYLFISHKPDPYFMINNSILKANDWELHKKLVDEGINPNEISKIIRNDEIEKLQEISSQSDFDFNKFIKPSQYEKCAFINQDNILLVDYAAFFSSIKCFKYLLMNGAHLIDTGKYAIAGGNLEIIHLCEQNHSSFDGAYEAAIIFHRNAIFKYIYDNKLEEINNLEELGIKCIFHDNYEVLLFLEKVGMKINDSLILESIKKGNLFIVQHFLEKNPIKLNILDISTFSGNKDLFDYLINNGFINSDDLNVF